MRINYLCNKSGIGLLATTLSISLILCAVGAGLYTNMQSFLAKKKVLNSSLLARNLARQGISYAFTELKRHSWSWFTHKVNGSGNLVPYHNNMDGAKELGVSFSIGEAQIDSNTNDYLPPKDNISHNSSLRVRTYRDPQNPEVIWIASFAMVDNKLVLMRAAINTQQIYDYVVFIPHDTGTYGWDVDGQGIGKVYVDGNIAFWSARFKDIAEISTNSKGTMYLGRNAIRCAPYQVDASEFRTSQWGNGGGPVNGLTFLRTYNGETLYKGSPFEQEWGFDRYPVENVNNRFWGAEWYHLQNDPKWVGYSGDITFTFTGDSEVGQKLGLTSGETAEFKLPRELHGKAGDPLWKEDVYGGDDYGTGNAVDEQPVRFIRLYKKKEYDSNGDGINDDYIWEVTSDLASAERAQIFNGKNDNGQTITLERNAITYNIPVIEFDDGDGTPDSTKFDVDYEKDFWSHAWGYTDNSSCDPVVKDFVENGLRRIDWDGNGSVETESVSILDTSKPGQAEVFKEWLSGDADYSKYEEKYRNPFVYNTGFNLDDIIKDGNNGAIDLTPLNLEESYSTVAKTSGLWIGVNNGNVEVWIANEKVYEGDLEGLNSNDNLPWINVKEYYTGTVNNHGDNPTIKKAKAITLNLEELKNMSITHGPGSIQKRKYARSVLNGSGIVWVDVPLDYVEEGYFPVLMLQDAKKIPRNGGFSFFCPEPVIVEGDLNYSDDEDYQWQPTSIISDSSVYLVSDAFDKHQEITNESVPPAYQEFYGSSQVPNDGTYNSWADIFKVAIGNDYWPKVSDMIYMTESEKENYLRGKFEKIQHAIEEYMGIAEHADVNVPSEIIRKDTDFCALSDDFDIYSNPDNFPDIEDGPDSIYNIVRESVTNAHDPLTGSKRHTVNYAFDHDPMESGESPVLHINSSIVLPASDAKIDRLEVWYYGGYHPPSPGKIIITGMTPRVVGAGGAGHWSHHYINVSLRGQLHCDPFGYVRQSIVAEDYNGKNFYPPGNTAFGSRIVMFLQAGAKKEDFNKHALL